MAALNDCLEDKLEHAGYNGMVKVAERELDNRLTQLARVIE